MQSRRVFAAQAFHDSLEGGRASGELTVSAAGFQFRCAKGTVGMPLQGAELRLGGASDRLLFITHPSRAGWSIYTPDLALLNDPAVAAHPQLAAMARRVRGRRAGNWALLVAALALVVALPLGIIFRADLLAAFAAERVPAEWEQKLGELAYSQYRVGAQFMDDAEAKKNLEALTAPLTGAVENSAAKFQFDIAKDKDINAFALPGGHVVINSELILRARSADEVLGVLGHEISHVTERHGLRAMITSAGLVLTLQVLLGDVQGSVTTLAGFAPLLLNLNYSRRFESEADRKGVELLGRAHINAAGMVSFFELVKQEEEKQREKMKDAPGGSTIDAMDSVSGLLRSHPATEERIENIRKLAEKQQGPYADLNPQFLALQERVRQFVAQSPPTEEKKDGNQN